MALTDNRVPSRFKPLISRIIGHVARKLSLVLLILFLLILLLRTGVLKEQAPTIPGLLDLSGAIVRNVTAVRDVVVSFSDNVFVYFQTQNALIQENRLLREHLQRMNKLENQLLQSESENLRLRQYKGSDMYASHISLSTKLHFRTPLRYFSSAVIPVGTNDGVFQGQVALSDNILIGRVAVVGTNFAELLLVSDVNSRVPVYLEMSGQRGILSGQLDRRLELLYFNDISQVNVGELILTSGDGQYYPADIMVAKVTEVKRGKVFAEMLASPSVYKPIDLLNGLGSQN